MRNLKKILALVLALVMSLSLMATAGAASFPDVDDDNPYATAIEVLDELKVFQGYKEDGTFRPTETLNRAQAAVLVYRIATGDVEDKFVANYTDMANSKFTDLDGYNWARGYINYCQNAEYVIGTTATTFAPGAKVTGYQLLVMLLRVLGYGKAGEFADPKGWELQTAAIAEREGITKNVTAGDFGAAAPRQMVAEILFRGLLTPTVQHNQLSGYTKDQTLGMKKFNLEEITGVITANEYADLYDVETMADGTTRMVVDGTARTLNITSELTDIGESRHAYVAGSKVFALSDSGTNVVAETGDKDTVKKLAETKGLNTKDAEHYLNFGGYGDVFSSDYRVEYEIDLAMTKQEMADYKKANNGNYTIYVYDHDDDPATPDVELPAYKADGTLDQDADGVQRYWFWYNKAIKVGDRITDTDMENIRDIFYTSDGKDFGTDRNTPNEYLGKVYVATQSKDDISDEISYREFYAKYINEGNSEADVTENENGNWLKIIDNNSDGKAEYVLKTVYTLDEVIGYNSRTEAYSYYSLNTRTWAPNYLDGYEPAVDDVVIYAKIDGKAHMKLADTLTATVKAVSYRDTTVTTTDDATYGQSAIENETGYAEVITNMSNTVEYHLYFDNYGYLRAYKEAEGSKTYGLLTEMYDESYQNGQFVRNPRWITELTAGDEDTTEYVVSNSKDNAFIGARWNNAWETPTNIWSSARPNYLQRAISHLDLKGEGVESSWTSNPYTFHSGAEFKYLPTATTPDSDGYYYSTTNIAKYTLGDDGNVALDTAAEYAYNKAGEQLYYYNNARVTRGEWNDANKGANSDTAFAAAITAGTVEYAYAVDYVWLQIKDLEKDTVYPINTNYDGHINGNKYVNAVHDTEYYVVDRAAGTVDYFTDYANLYKIPADKIHAIYAVAENTTDDKDSKDYWVANVIVVELKESLVSSFDSISLAIYNPYKETDRVKNLDTLNNKHEGIVATVVPASENWPLQWTGYGFYGLAKPTTTEEDTISTKSITRITKGSYNDNGIYAGTIERLKEVDSRGEYIMVWNGLKSIPVYVNDAPFYSVHSSGVKDTKYVAVELADREINRGDKIIYVMNGSKVAFVVDLEFTDNGAWGIPGWLTNGVDGEWEDIIAEQTTDTRVVLGVTLGMINNTDLSIDNVRGNVEGTASFVKSTGFDDPSSANYHSGQFRYPKGTSVIKFHVTTAGTVSIGSISFAGSNWTVTDVTPDATGANVTAYLNEVQTASRYIDNVSDKIVIATVEYIQTVVEAEANRLMTELAALTEGTEAWEAKKAELEAVQADLEAYQKGAAVAENAALATELTNKITEVEVAMGENAAVNAVNGIKDAWTAYNAATPKTEPLTKALVDAIKAYKAAEDSMTDAQKTDASASLTAAQNAISALDDDFNTAYETWTSDKTLAKANAAKTAAPKTWEVAAFDAINTVTAPTKTLAEKVAEVEAAITAAQPIKAAYDKVVTAATAYNGAASDANIKALIAAYDAAIVLGMNNTAVAGNQPYDLLHDAADWETYVAGMTNAAGLKSQAAPVDGQLKKFKMDPYKAAFYGYEVESPVETGEHEVTVTITMPKGQTEGPALTTMGEVREWFGQVGVTGGEFVYEPAGDTETATVPETNTILIPGKNGGADLTVRIEWVESNEIRYRANLWGINKLNIALYDIGAEKMLSADDIEALSLPESPFKFRVGGTAMSPDFAWNGGANVAEGTTSVWGKDWTNIGFIQYAMADPDVKPFENQSIKADTIDNKIDDSTVSFDLVNNSGLVITYWTAEIVGPTNP